MPYKWLIPAVLILGSSALAANAVSKIHIGTAKIGAEVSIFAPNTAQIFVTLKMTGTKGTLVKAAWVAEKVDASAGVSPNFVVYYNEVKLPVTSDTILVNNLNFNITKPTKGWPKGKYRLDIFVAAGNIYPKQPLASVPFEVR